MNEDEEYPNQRIRLIPCDICGRNFNQEILSRHKNICKKSTSKNRKTFDSGKQRSEGSDVQYKNTKDTKKVQVLGQKPEVAPPQSNWREKHNEFIRNVRNARVVTEAIKTGGPVPKFEASAVPSDYVNCIHCNRNFSSAAAERHIPFCETQKKRQKPNASANRQPKVPLPSQKKNSTDNSGQGNDNSNGYQRPGYSSGYGNGGKGYASGNDRKPIKYDSNLYYESDGQDSGYGKNRSANMSKQQQDQNLRTGRNQSNNELNTMARNRGQKDSPLPRRYGNQASPSGPNRNGSNAQNQQRQTSGGQQPQQKAGSAGVAKFCHECGSEFPVKWARFCSFCGDRRL